MSSEIYLFELRKRLLRSMLVIGIVFAILCFFSSELYYGLALPLLKNLPNDNKLIAIGVISPFVAPFKFAFVVSIFLTVPYILLQIWSFVAPALYHNEKRIIYPLLLLSIVLFYLGVAFAYFLVLPTVLQFFIHFAPKVVEMRPDVSEYLDFTLNLFFAFGIAFEVPIFTLLLVWTGVTTVEKLRSYRRYFIVAAFVVGMLLTPPDVISQTMLAIPLWLLFELGLFLAKFIYK